MNRRRMRSPMSDADKREQWGPFADNEEELLDEVEARWGDIAAYAESARKVSTYTKKDWERINSSNTAIERRIQELMDSGAEPTSAEAMEVAEEQRRHISRWFYSMDHSFHVQKSDLYVQDPRFRAGVEKNTRPGAAECPRSSITKSAGSISRKRSGRSSPPAGSRPSPFGQSLPKHGYR